MYSVHYEPGYKFFCLVWGLWHALITRKWTYQSWVHCAKSCPESLECQNRTTSGGTAELLSSKSLVSSQLPARKQIHLTQRNFYFYYLIQLNDAQIWLLFTHWEPLYHYLNFNIYTKNPTHTHHQQPKQTNKTNPTKTKTKQRKPQRKRKSWNIIQHQDWISFINDERTAKKITLILN